ncbi:MULTISPECIES: SpoIIE family protein phosphatase [unclassified Streptomyces]|uniref:SpoIIE family protein phosphatase n=1 Tax=unclassified Streptomyces TaxID=2593676 RepID=UPI0038294161
MSEVDRRPLDVGHREAAALGPSGLMDILGVAAVLLDDDGRIDMWSPQAEELFGYPANEAVGQYAALLLVDPRDQDAAVRLFAEVMETGRSWAGAFPIRCKDGSTRLVEFRNVRLSDSAGGCHALGLATDRSRLQTMERGLALAYQLVEQSPIGLAVMDTGLRYLSVNPALARMHGLTEDDHMGRAFREVLPRAEFGQAERTLWEVLDTGVPVVDRYVVGRTAADLDHDHAWAVSFYRLEDQNGLVLGVACSVVDVTDRHSATLEADRARRRLALIADGSARLGTTLEVVQTARELADVVVPEPADMAAVDVLDAVLEEQDAEPAEDAPVFRTLASKTTHSTRVARLRAEPETVVTYPPAHLAALCVRTGRPQLITHVGDGDLLRISRDEDEAADLAEAGVHTAMAVPLIARGRVLGVLGLGRARDPQPFDEDDVTVAWELASRAAVCIDNARLHQRLRSTAETLQRSLLPQLRPCHPCLEVAARYRPAQASSEVGGDWYDVIALEDGKAVLVVGDVMGSGVPAATTMGRLRTAASTLAVLNLEPAQILGELDKSIQGREHADHSIATCVLAVFDPERGECRVANAGHLPPIVVRDGERPELLDLPTGTPLGVGGVPFQNTVVRLGPGDALVLYTDGLVETRDQPIDERLSVLVDLLHREDRSVEETCDRLLAELRRPGCRDDVALLIARSRPRPPATTTPC